MAPVDHEQPPKPTSLIITLYFRQWSIEKTSLGMTKDNDGVFDGEFFLGCPLHLEDMAPFKLPPPKPKLYDMPPPLDIDELKTHFNCGRPNGNYITLPTIETEVPAAQQKIASYFWVVFICCTHRRP